MIKRFGELLARLGFRRGEGRHFFALDDNLHTALVKLADQEKRPAEEARADRLATALAQRQTHGELWRRWRSLSPPEPGCPGAGLPGYTNQ
ncbi:MAG TPA: hypothetical protein VII97_06645 [Anaerolineales bacterium]